MRQGTKPVEVLRRQFVTSPQSGRSRHGIEILEVHHSGGSFVVIATHEGLSQFPGTFDDLIRTGPVTDDVPQVHHSVKGRGGANSGVKGFKIGVNIANQQYAHESPDKLQIIDECPALRCIVRSQPEKDTMTAAKRAGWRFKNRTPLWFKIIVALLAADAIAHIGLLSTVSAWAQPRRDPVHSYLVPFMDGRNYFVQSWLGQYLDSWWIGIGLLVLMAILLFVNRDQLERSI